MNLWISCFIPNLSVPLTFSLLCFEINVISLIFNLVLLFHVACVLRHYIILTEHWFVIKMVMSTLLIFRDAHWIFELINIAESYRLISTILVILLIYILLWTFLDWFWAWILWSFLFSSNIEKIKSERYRLGVARMLGILTIKFSDLYIWM